MHSTSTVVLPLNFTHAQNLPVWILLLTAAVTQHCVCQTIGVGSCGSLVFIVFMGEIPSNALYESLLPNWLWGKIAWIRRLWFFGGKYCMSLRGKN